MKYSESLTKGLDVVIKEEKYYLYIEDIPEFLDRMLFFNQLFENMKKNKKDFGEISGIVGNVSSEINNNEIIFNLDDRSKGLII